jgi:hypothetical protein
MQSEQGYYLAELLKVAWALLPIALILIAVIFLRRRERTRRTLLLQLTAVFWLLAAGASQVLLNRAVGVSIFPQNHIFHNEREVTERADFYFRLFRGLHIVEQVAFVLFAVSLLIFFRRRSNTLDAANRAPVRCLAFV